MEWVLAMQLQKILLQDTVDGRIDWGMMNHLFDPEDWV
jgi:hypothetical protein